MHAGEPRFSLSLSLLSAVNPRLAAHNSTGGLLRGRLTRVLQRRVTSASLLNPRLNYLPTYLPFYPCPRSVPRLSITPVDLSLANPREFDPRSRTKVHFFFYAFTSDSFFFPSRSGRFLPILYLIILFITRRCHVSHCIKNVRSKEHSYKKKK